MMRLFSPRKTTLMFVIRDKTRVCFLSCALFDVIVRGIASILVVCLFV